MKTPSTKGSIMQLPVATFQERVKRGLARWKFNGSMDRFRIEVTDADPVRYAGQGFIERCVTYTTGRRVTVTSVREAPDRVIFEGRSA